MVGARAGAGELTPVNYGDELSAAETVAEGPTPEGPYGDRLPDASC